jgi:hypothetical protein
MLITFKSPLCYISNKKDSLFWFHRAFLNINYALHQPIAHIYLKSIKIFYKMLDKKTPNICFGLSISQNICWGFLSNIL